MTRQMETTAGLRTAGGSLAAEVAGDRATVTGKIGAVTVHESGGKAMRMKANGQKAVLSRTGLLDPESWPVEESSNVPSLQQRRLQLIPRRGELQKDRDD